MSIPPGGYPTNYGVPPPKATVGNGWNIAGLGCLALFLLAAVGGVLLVRAFKTERSHPSKGTALGVVILAGKAAVDGAQLRQAIVAAHQSQGQYPASLIDLVVQNRIDGKLLHNDLDDSPSPAHLSWRYFKPAENAPGNTPLLEEPFQMTTGGKPQFGHIVITLDGQSRTEVSSQAQAPPHRAPLDQAP